VDRFKREYIEAKAVQEHSARKAARERTKKGLPDENIKKDVYDPKLYPKFTVKPIPLSRAVNASVIDILLVAGGAVVLFMLAFVGFMRYDPR
jgi:hypothetical protein